MRIPKPSIFHWPSVMNRPVSRMFLAALLLPATIPCAQEFDVAAVKPHAASVPCGESNAYPGGRLVLNCFTLSEMIREALDLQPSRSDELTGGEDWVRTELWDVTAKAAGVAGEMGPAAYRPMPLKLAEQQFELKLRSEKREVKGLQLVIDHKAKPRPGLHPNGGTPYRFDLKPGMSLTAQRVSMKEFAAWLKMPMAVGERVTDKTGLAGEYDFVLKWTLTDIQRVHDTPPLTDAPTIFTALKQQLGLKLKSGRVLVDV